MRFRMRNLATAWKKAMRRAPERVAPCSPALAALALLLVACGSSAGTRSPSVEFLTSEETLSLSLPFSDAVRVGHLLFVSGQVGNLPGSLDLASGGMQAEARQALENIRSILVRSGSSMDRVVKCTVFLADMADWPDFNTVYLEFFPDHPPARSALGANGLALGARVEIECIAVCDEQDLQ